MSQSTPERGGSTSISGGGSVLATPRRAAATLLVSLSTLVALCAKQANRASKKLQIKLKSKQLPRLELRSPQLRPKRFLKNISNTAITLIHKKKNKRGGGGDAEEEWGDGGVWQKAILMGDKCEPLDFSGVIYYDSNGKQLNEVPLRSPRASPLPAFLATSHRQVYWVEWSFSTSKRHARVMSGRSPKHVNGWELGPFFQISPLYSLYI